MVKLWKDTFAAQKGSLQERVTAAVTAVCERYQLVFYAGEKGKLKRQTKMTVTPAPGTKKAELDAALSGTAVA
jgi:hypothetical protein